MLARNFDFTWLASLISPTSRATSVAAPITGARISARRVSAGPNPARPDRLRPQTIPATSPPPTIAQAGNRPDPAASTASRASPVGTWAIEKRTGGERTERLLFV